MSSSNNNTIYKKTSFLAGASSKLIEELYSQYLIDPDSLSRDWQTFFEGLGDEKNAILSNFNGPSWSPKKKNYKIKKN